ILHWTQLRVHPGVILWLEAICPTTKTGGADPHRGAYRTVIKSLQERDELFVSLFERCLCLNFSKSDPISRFLHDDGDLAAVVSDGEQEGSALSRRLQREGTHVNTRFRAYLQ